MLFRELHTMLQFVILAVIGVEIARSKKTTAKTILKMKKKFIDLMSILCVLDFCYESLMNYKLEYKHMRVMLIIIMTEKVDLIYNWFFLFLFSEIVS